MEHREFLDVVVAEAGALADAARAAGPEAPVPATPEWSMAKLAKHTGTTHRWATAVVTTRAFANPGDLDLGLPETDAGYADWIEAGAAAFRATLAAADPDAECWSWGADPHVRFWSRRMAHETAVHRWDAQSALGASAPIPTGLAVDGIDERLANLPPSLEFGPDPPEILTGTGQTLHLHTTDADGEWLIRFDPEGMTVTREHAKGDCAIRGPASDLLLFLVGRRELDGLDVFGDLAVIGDRDGIRRF